MSGPRAAGFRPARGRANSSLCAPFGDEGIAAGRIGGDVTDHMEVRLRTSACEDVVREDGTGGAVQRELGAGPVNSCALIGASDVRGCVNCFGGLQDCVLSGDSGQNEYCSDCQCGGTHQRQFERISRKRGSAWPRRPA